MKDLEEFAIWSLILLGAMTVGWAVCVVGLSVLGVL